LRRKPSRVSEKQRLSRVAGTHTLTLSLSGRSGVFLFSRRLGIPAPLTSLLQPTTMNCMSTAILSIVALAIAGAFTGALWRLVGALSHTIPTAQPVVHQEAPAHQGELLAAQQIALEARLDKLTLAVSDGIERVHRAESRIQKTVSAARRLVREAGLEHAGIEAEYEELRPADAEGVEPLPAVPEQVAETRTIRIPGGELKIGAA